jgi:hypothetical protein
MKKQDLFTSIVRGAGTFGSASAIERSDARRARGTARVPKGITKTILHRTLATAEAVFVVCAMALGASAADAQTITQIIDSTGDGTGNSLSRSQGIVVDSSGNVYVAGFGNSNAFKITPGGVITEIIDSTGDGAGNTIGFVVAIAVDGSGNVYVPGGGNNAFKIATPGTCSTGGTPCTITEIIDSTGDGSGNLLSFPSPST